MKKSRDLYHHGVFSIDGKHKMTWNKIPVQPCGVIDGGGCMCLAVLPYMFVTQLAPTACFVADGKFHIVAIAITTHEGRWDYNTIVNSLVLGTTALLEQHYTEIVNEQLRPMQYDGGMAHTISDNCGEVADGVMDVFAGDEDHLHINCFMHLIICNLTKKGQSNFPPNPCCLLVASLAFMAGTNLNGSMRNPDESTPWIKAMIDFIAYLPPGFEKHHREFLHCFLEHLKQEEPGVPINCSWCKSTLCVLL